MLYDGDSRNRVEWERPQKINARNYPILFDLEIMDITSAIFSLSNHYHILAIPENITTLSTPCG